MDEGVVEVKVLPLQAQAFGNAQARTGRQQGQSFLRARQTNQNREGLFGAQNHRFITAQGLAADKP